jgi:3-keto-5-aminohexanoate cleavage enzyme
LTTGTVNFGQDVFWNPRPLVRDIATRIKGLGLKPEIECFDAGMIDEARALEKEGFVTMPAHFDFVLGVGGALGATTEALDFMRSYIPPGSTWTCAAMGRHQLTFVEHAAERGGNARVGLEDNIYVSKGVLAKGNWELVQERPPRIGREPREAGRPS